MSFKIRLILLFCLLQSIALISQNVVTLNGNIYDADTKASLPFVNIGFLNESVGTVSDENGRFELKFDLTKISNSSILQISYIGYNTVRIQASSFFASVAQEKDFFLEPAPYDLDEVVIKNDLRKENELGTLKLNHNRVAYWLNPEALGGEIATKFSIDKEKTKLHELRFYMVKNNSSGIEARVNVYEYKNGFPGKNLLTQNIYHTIKSASGIETVNLEPYNIYVDNDIVVSLELIKVHGRFIDFEIGGSDYKTNSFSRLSNQDNWERFPQIGIAMKLKTSYPSTNGKVIPQTRIAPKNITIYWDASLSMQNKDRDIKKELDLLEKYLKELKKVNVKIIKFTTVILDTHDFFLTTANYDGVIDYLENTKYDGEADFADILKTNDSKPDAALLFSNAETILEPLEQTVYLPTFAINSIPKANHNQLQTASFYGDGHYINLSETSVNKGLEMMLNEFKDDISYDEKEPEETLIKGRIVGDSLSIPYASIKVKDSYKETKSDSLGNFRINASAGDILMVDALGMWKKELKLSNFSDITIKLAPNSTQLNEVTLYGKTKKEVVTTMTPYGEKNVDAVGFSSSELTQDDFAAGDITYDDIIGRLPGVMISGAGTSKRYSFLINVMSTTGKYTDPNPLIVIDDMPYHQIDGLDHLPPIDFKTIVSVKAIKSVAGTNRYGGAAAYGVIEMRTEATAQAKDTKPKKTENSALAKGNDYIDNGIPSIDNVGIKTSYLIQLNAAKNFEEAKQIYHNQKENTPQSVEYYVEVSDYFKKWNNDYSYVVLSNIAAFADENTKALRTLAFKLEESEHLDTARLIYERIANLRPNEAQSYLDLANIYKVTASYQKSMQLYKEMLSNSIPGIDFSGFQQLIVDEMRHLLAFHKSSVDFQDLPSELLAANFKQDLRLVFEWNDPTAEFELQFVNPQKKFYKCSHTKFENAERLLDEVKNGYMTESYIIDDEEPGEWIINIEALNEEPSINPNYLKYTVYKNYGLKNETKTVKVIKLQDIKEKATLDKFKYKQ
ncbi:CarboxypepD_reg-like domain-containing protein [Flavobacteriaceae bacterium MAR_2010_188]|nr:CarboxypepD_reg-like domain-containing protein [Flavobacteriaceae bacterium MAR_2010_188]